MNRWGILNNSMSTPTDTPVRDERTPPAMDVQAYADASTREFDMGRFYAKYLEDLPPGTALPTDDVKSQYPDMAGGQVALAWTLYEQYGDRATLAANYPLMKTFVDRNATEKPSLIWPGNQGFGDWCPPIHGDAANGGMGSPSAGDCFSEVSIVNTALSYKQADDTAKAAAALGQPADAAHFRQLADDIKAAFNRTFLNAAGNAYGERPPDDQHPAAGVRHGARRQPRRRSATSWSRTSCVDNGGHLDTGIFGTRYIVDALAAIGRIDVAMTVLGQTTYPSFGFELAHGRDHAVGGVDLLLRDGDPRPRDVRRRQRLAVHPARRASRPASPGYRDVASTRRSRPASRTCPRAMTRSAARSPRSGLRRTDTFRLDVRVPANVVATVHVPHPAGQFVLAPAGAQRVGEDLYRVAGGDWSFNTAKTSVDVAGRRSAARCRRPSR